MIKLWECRLWFIAGLVSLTLAAAPNAFAQTDMVNAGTNAPTDTAPIATNNAPVYLAPAVSQAISNASSQPGAAEKPDPNLQDIRPPYFFIRSYFWLWVILAAVVALATIIGLCIWLWPRRQLSAKSAYELTLERLEKAKALLREDEPMPYAVTVSEVIRSYLGQRFQSPSTRRTTDEFLRTMEIDPTSHLAEHRDLLRGFLQSCDLVKFARYQPTLSELQQVQQNAYSFVVATKPIESAHRNGKAS